MMTKCLSLDKPSHSKLQGLAGAVAYWFVHMLQIMPDSIPFPALSNIFCNSCMCGKKHRPLTNLSGPA